MKAYMRHIPFIVVLAIVSLVMTREGGLNLPTGKPRVGEWTEVSPVLVAPNTSFATDNKGTRARLSDYEGKVVLLNIWATWCTPCIKELPTLKALDEQYETKGLKVVTLSVDSFAFAQLEAFLKHKVNIALPSLAHDDSGQLYSQLNAKGLPVTYLIDKQGNITHRFIGATDWLDDKARLQIDAALAK